MKNCPFYGRHFHPLEGDRLGPPFILLDTRGNECAIIRSAFAPCQMEVAGQTVDWAECPLLQEIRV